MSVLKKFKIVTDNYRKERMFLGHLRDKRKNLLKMKQMELNEALGCRFEGSDLLKNSVLGIMNSVILKPYF